MWYPLSGLELGRIAYAVNGFDSKHDDRCAVSTGLVDVYIVGLLESTKLLDSPIQAMLTVQNIAFCILSICRLSS